MSEETPTDKNEFEDAVQDVLAMNKQSQDKQAFEGAVSDAQEMQAARDAAKHTTDTEQQTQKAQAKLDRSDRLLKMGAAAAVGLITATAIHSLSDNDKQPEEDIPAIIKQQDDIERRLQNGEIGPIDFENNKITIEVPEDSK